MKRMTGYAGFVAAMAMMFSIVFPFGSYAQQSMEKKELYYLVIDSSMSIARNELKKPIENSVFELIDSLNQRQAVRLLFFSTEKGKTYQWSEMTTSNRENYKNIFTKQFDPFGKTKLYDTVGYVFKNVEKDIERFSRVNIFILSDGKDNRSEQYEDWSELEDLAENIKTKREGSVMRWYTLGFDPEKTPDENGPITRIPVDKPSKINWIPPPDASFSAFPPAIEAGESVAMWLKSVGGVESVKWQFGDGETSDELSPRHTYDKKGTYDVTVQVSGPKGKDKRTKKHLIKVYEDVPLKAQFDWRPSEPRVGESVQFLNQSQGGPGEFAWDITDTGTKTKRNPQVTFKKSGKKNVELTVKRKNKQDTMEKAVQVRPPLPDATFQTEPKELQVGEEVELKAKETKDTWQHRWVIGREVKLQGSEVTWESNLEGRIRVVHNVKGPGGSADASEVLFIKPAPEPEADFTWTPDEIHQGEEILFVDESLGAPENYTWMFPNVGKRTERNPSVVFPETGEITVSLKVEKEGESDTVQKKLDVQPPPPLEADFRWSPKPVRKGKKIDFIDESVGSPESYTWSFPGIGKRTERNPTVVFSKTGQVQVSLKIQKGNRSEAAEKDIQVLPPPIRASFEVSATKGRESLKVEFTDTSKGEIASYHWKFGDGATSDVKNPVHTYRNDGNEPVKYRPRLTIEDAKGNKAKDPGTHEITVKPPWPLWMKIAPWVVGVIAAWVILMRFVAAVISPKFVLQENGTRRQIRAKRLLRHKKLLRYLFLPRSYVTLGTARKHDITSHMAQNADASKPIAYIKRIPFSNTYKLVPVQKEQVPDDSLSDGSTTLRKQMSFPIGSHQEFERIK